MSWFDRLKATVGLGPVITRASVRSEPKAIVGQLPLGLQLMRIGGAMTPQQISSIILEADMGIMWRLMDLGNEARQKDGHLQCVLGTRENALAQLPWTCTAPAVRKGKGKGKPRARDQKIADWLTDALQQALPPAGATAEIGGFSDLIAHLTGAAYTGYSVAETLLVKQSGLIVPTGWSRLAPRRFGFDMLTGRLVWQDQSGPTASVPVDLMATYPGRFIQHQPRINGDVPCREGLVRVLMWAALFRNWTIRDWLTLAELAWKPWRTGTYTTTSGPTGRAASSEDKSNLEEALDKMSANGVAVFPDSTEVKIEWPRSPPAQNSNHKELCDFMGAEMSKAVLGQTLTTEQGSRGSQSLGKVHDAVRGDILEYDARSVASTIRRHLIAPLVRMNFGDDVAIPEFAFLTDDSTDMKAFSEAIKNLREAGTKVPAKWVADKIGMPEAKEGDELLGDDSVDVDVDGLKDPEPPTEDDAPTEDEPEEEAA